MYVCENYFITTHQDTIKPSLDIIGSISNILFQVNMIYLTKDLMLLLLGLENWDDELGVARDRFDPLQGLTVPGHRRYGLLGV